MLPLLLTITVTILAMTSTTAMTHTFASLVKRCTYLTSQLTTRLRCYKHRNSRTYYSTSKC